MLTNTMINEHAYRLISFNVFHNTRLSHIAGSVSICPALSIKDEDGGCLISKQK